MYYFRGGQPFNFMRQYFSPLIQLRHNVKNGLSKHHNVSYWTTFSRGKSYTAGVSNLWASGGQFAYMSNGAEGHMSWDLIAYVSNRARGRMWFRIWGSPSLWATSSEIWPRDGLISKKKVITFLTSEKLPLNDKDMYLYSVACDQNFMHLFINCLLQYC